MNRDERDIVQGTWVVCDICQQRLPLERNSAVAFAELVTFVDAHDHPGFAVSVTIPTGIRDED